jgi:hypothetical protein
MATIQPQDPAALLNLRHAPLETGHVPRDPAQRWHIELWAGNFDVLLEQVRNRIRLLLPPAYRALPA